MSFSHKKRRLSLEKSLIPVDNNTIFLAHFDITTNDVLSGITPYSDVSTLRSQEGKFGGGVAVEASTINLVLNPTINYTTQTNIGWDNNLNGTLRPNGSWSTGYNSGVASANVGYHAHVNIDRFGYPVFEFIDMNSQFDSSLKHRWLGITQQIASNASGNLGWQGGTQVSISFDMMADHIDKGINTGIYHRNKGDTANTFGSTQATSFVSKPFEWERIERTFTLVDSEWDFTKYATLYIYGYHYRNDYEGIGWVKNVQIETKSFASSFVNGTRGGGSIEYELNANPDNITISFWAKNKTAGGFYVELKCDTGDNNRIWFRPTTASSIDGGKTINGVVKASGETSVDNMIDKWNMYTITSEGSTVRLYFNGKKVKESTSVGALNKMGKYLVLNGANRGSDRNCIFDELRIDNIVRTDEEIESWYISGQPFSPKGIYRLAY